MRKLFSIALGVFAAAGAAVVAAVCLAILEIYLAGHGYRTLMDQIVIGNPDSGSRLSTADLIALLISGASGVTVTWLTWRRADRRAN